MGRYYWDKKATVEDCRSVSISFLRKHDYFCGHRPGRIFWTNSMGEETGSIGIIVNVAGEPYIKFNYTVTDRSSGQKTDYDYKVTSQLPRAISVGFAIGSSARLFGIVFIVVGGSGSCIKRRAQNTSAVGTATIFLMRVGMSHDLQGLEAGAIYSKLNCSMRNFIKKPSDGLTGADLRKRH